MIGHRWAWRSGPEGLLVDDVVVSFQRYRCPLDKIVREVPSSHGALPVAPEGDRFLLALPSGEAFWAGVIVPKDWGCDALSLAAVQPDGKVLMVDRSVRSGIWVFPGIKRTDGQFDVFWRESVSELQLSGAGGAKSIIVCDPDDFVARTGQAAPEPFNPRVAFGGWRLP